eukprot:TRINITY_DN12957_c1_g1_i1.p1 TRINITY_DN12957_c1_g1~~TRINITY_DN12957_c1_g1_i1.p1  ORF type:complete len:594 (-),score=45.48 TRINITY_DN12957_c1_g1_i1:551-2332(-)
MGKFLAFLLILLSAMAIAHSAPPAFVEVVRKTKVFKPVPQNPGQGFTFRPDPPSNASRPFLADADPAPPRITRAKAGPNAGFLTPGTTTPRSLVTYSSAKGPVMNVVNLYFIWYGTFDASSKAIHRNFVNSLGIYNPRTPGVATVSGWWDLSTPLGDAGKNFVAPNVVIRGERDDNYSQGKGRANAGLTYKNLATIVTSAFTSRAFSTDVNGIYAVMTWKDVFVDGFCTKHCGYHTTYTYNSTVLKYLYVANKPCSGCSAGKGPNGNADADAALSVLAHELSETATDPLGNAWTNTTNGYENADACAWYFGQTFSANGGIYNMVGKDGQKFLVQQNYEIGSNLCYTNAPNPPPSQITSVSYLYQNQYLYSLNGRFVAILQVDQNFVLYDGATPNPGAPLATFSSGTQFSGANSSVMQADGNFTLFKRGTIPVWTTATGGSGANKLVLQNDGNLILFTPANVAVWASGTNSLDSGNGLNVSSFIASPAYLVSPSYRYKLWVQTSGNVVLYDGAQAKVLWSSGTAGSAGNNLVYQPDGKLVLYTDASFTVQVWSSVTALPVGESAGSLAVQDDGNVVLRTATNVVYWSTNTAQIV